MADNVQVDHGTGASESVVISFDELLGGLKVQRVKLQTGTDGQAQDINGDNPLPVAISGTPTVSGTVAISGTPTVAISGTPTVEISGTPTVSGTVAISGTPTVEISGTPTVALSGGSELGVEGEALEVLRTIARALALLVANDGSPDVYGRKRVAVETIANMSTVSTVSNMAAIGGYNAQHQIPVQMDSLYAAGLRSRITVS